jgi:hypothetical protein
MATLTATGAQAAVQPKGLRVGLVAVRSVFSINVSLSAGDVIQMVKVPAGATPVFIQWGGNPKSAFFSQVEVGDGIVTGRYRSMATYSQAEAMLFATIPVTPYLYSVDDTIDILMSVSTIQSPGGAFYMNVIFSMDSTY